MVWFIIVFFIGVFLGVSFMALAVAAGRNLPTENNKYSKV
jgi:hypothetical protein